MLALLMVQRSSTRLVTVAAAAGAWYQMGAAAVRPGWTPTFTPS